MTDFAGEQQYAATFNFTFPPGTSPEEATARTEQLLQIAHGLAPLVGASLSHELSFVAPMETNIVTTESSSGFFAPEIQQSLDKPIGEFLYSAPHVMGTRSFRTRVGNVLQDRGIMTVKDMLASGSDILLEGSNLGTRTVQMVKDILREEGPEVPLEQSPRPESVVQFCRSLDEVPINGLFVYMSDLPCRISIAKALQFDPAEVQTVARLCGTDPNTFVYKVRDFAEAFAEAQTKLGA